MSHLWNKSGCFLSTEQMHTACGYSVLRHIWMGKHTGPGANSRASVSSSSPCRPSSLFLFLFCCRSNSSWIFFFCAARKVPASLLLCGTCPSPRLLVYRSQLYVSPLLCFPSALPIVTHTHMSHMSHCSQPHLRVGARMGRTCTTYTETIVPHPSPPFQ